MELQLMRGTACAPPGWVPNESWVPRVLDRMDADGSSSLPASLGCVSLDAIPPPGQWDSGWVARIGALSPLDLAMLAKQNLHRCGLLYPNAKRMGPGSAAYAKLGQHWQSNLEFVSQLRRINPEGWLRRTEYDLDSLTLMTAEQQEASADR